MVRSLIEPERCSGVKKRVYLPDVDEYRSSSRPLSEVVLDTIGSVSCTRSKPLKEGYVADLTREAGVSPCSMILGLLYITRLSRTNPRFLRSVSSKDLFLTSMMIASKYLNDEGESEALTNSEWADIGCRPKTVLDEMERQFLAAIDWRLYVPLEEYYSFVSGIEGRIALNQFAQRGWLTYTDLVTVWDAMDTQKALLTATKHVAKVTCGSAAVYLVLLSTLLAASHTLNTTWTASSPSSSPTPSSSPSSSPSPSSSNTSNTSTTPSLQETLAMLSETSFDLSPSMDLHIIRGQNMEHLLETDILGVSLNGLPIERCRVKRRDLEPLDFPTVLRPRLDFSVDTRDAIPIGRWATFGRETKSMENFGSYWKDFRTSGKHRSGEAVESETVYRYSFSYFWSRTVQDWFQNGLSVFTAVVQPLIPARNSTSYPEDCEPAVVKVKGSVPGFLKDAHQQFDPYIGTAWSLGSDHHHQFGGG